MTLTCEALVEGHLDALHGFAMAWTRQKDVAEDAVQRAFLKAFERLHQLRDPGAVRGWLLAILRNEITAEYRSRSRIVALEGGEWDELPGEEPEEPGLDPVLLEGLPGALAQLPESAREILLLRFQQELSYDEIMQVLGLPLGTVQSRLHRAKLALKTLLEPQLKGGVA
ncbi:MAG TPA: RNA polymerase sigma factor [Holophagaceae bacterium]|nr:RNA polymerase sigma factor [Holophagaceae bacterium]